jgi:hypothetical protein
MVYHKPRNSLPTLDVDPGWCTCTSITCNCMFVCILCLSVVHQSYTVWVNRAMWYQPDARRYGLCICASCKLNIICMPPRSQIICVC